jgi:YHS domain-containing protein
MEKDPVCGMEVGPKTASAKSNYQGKMYYFCSVDGKKTFDNEPYRYAQSSMKHGGSQIRNGQTA